MVPLSVYQFLLVVLGSFTVGGIVGVDSVWRRLRKKRNITIEEWKYSAEKKH